MASIEVPMKKQSDQGLHCLLICPHLLEISSASFSGVRIVLILLRHALKHEEIMLIFGWGMKAPAAPVLPSQKFNFLFFSEQ